LALSAANGYKKAVRLRRIPTSALLGLVLFAGCEKQRQVEEVREYRPPEPVEAEIGNYALLAESWENYLNGPPKLVAIRAPSSGILDLLKKEQELVKSVLDTSGPLDHSAEYAELKGRLAELKSLVPEAETARGYVPASRGTATHVSGNNIIIRSRRGHYLYGYDYTPLRAQHKSSSPELVRSVQNIVPNATLELKDLEQRIAILNGLVKKWERTTSVMNRDGSSGLIRSANESYLAALADFTRQFSELRDQLEAISENRAVLLQNRNSILREWNAFERNRLEILKDYIQENAHHISEPTQSNRIERSWLYEFPKITANDLVRVLCRVGDRELYFEVSAKRHRLHAFTLIDISPAPG